MDEALQQAFAAYSSRPTTVDDYASAQGMTQGGENGLWGRQGDDGWRATNQDDLLAQFTQSGSPRGYLDAAGGSRYMTYAPGQTLDSATSSEYQRLGMSTLRDTLQRFDPGFQEQNWLAAGSEQNPFEVPLYARSDQYNYGAQAPQTDSDHAKMVAMALFAAAAGGAGIAAAGGGAGAGAAGGALADATAGIGGAAGMFPGMTAADLAVGGGVASAAGAASPYAAWGATDPIQMIMQLDTLSGGAGATAGAQGLGYGSVADALANASAWAGPGFSAAQGGGGAAGGTPDATTRGLTQNLGKGVNISDILRSVTGDLGTTLAKFGVPGFSGASGVMGGAMGGGAAGMMSPWSIGQGLYGLYSANRMKKQAAEAGKRADPWGAYRGDAAGRLDALSRDPSSITSDPGYEAGLQAVQRSMAAQGYQGSGNMMAALQKYGGDFYEKAIARLSGLAGAGQNPAAGPTLEMQGNVNATNLIGQSFNRLSYGVNR